MSDDISWPKYESHKVVQAKIIVALEKDDETGVRLWVAGNEPFEPTVSAMKDKASYGDYAVLYPDGYKSISPKKAFEEGYTEVQS